MNDWLATLSKSTIAALAIAGGIAFIILASPPVTICDAELELLVKKQTGFIFLDKKFKSRTTSQYEILRDHCRATNSPGGCFELFQEISRLQQDIVKMPRQCWSKGASQAQVKKALWEVLELMVKVAWGEKPPVSYYDKFNWLDSSNIAVFCQLKSLVTEVFGEVPWNTFREKMMTELPGAETMQRQKVWEALILSVNCEQYK